MFGHLRLFALASDEQNAYSPCSRARTFCRSPPCERDLAVYPRDCGEFPRLLNIRCRRVLGTLDVQSAWQFANP